MVIFMKNIDEINDFEKMTAEKQHEFIEKIVGTKPSFCDAVINAVRKNIVSEAAFTMLESGIFDDKAHDYLDDRDALTEICNNVADEYISKRHYREDLSKIENLEDMLEEELDKRKEDLER